MAGPGKAASRRRRRERGSTPGSRNRRVGLALALAAAAAVALLIGRGTPADRPSLLLVTIDTLRADRVGTYGYAPPTTPVLDGLAARGVRFESVQSASPLTGPSHATILTGQYPPVHGVRDNARFVLGERTPTLAERLEPVGYDTAAFVSAFPVARAFGFGRGFGVFDEGLRPSAATGGVAERPGNETADAAAGWLRARSEQPFFAWVHLFDPHEPYAPPAAYRERFESPYDGEIAFADAQLGRLLEALRSAGRLDRTIVVVLSDHGEGFGEHGESTHGLLIYESTLRVPFVVAGPGVPAGRVVRERVGTIDLVPTLLALVGLDVPEGLAGRDLTPALTGRGLPPKPLYSESLYGRLNARWAALRGWTHDDWKLVDGGHHELFDLERDPGEEHDRAEEEPRRAEPLEEALRRATTAMTPGGDRVGADTLSPVAAERLQALGYVAGGSGGGDVDEPGLPDPRDRLPVFERLRALGGATGPTLGPALGEVEGLARQEPENPFAQDVLAGLAFRAGRLDIAAGALARFLELEPDRVDVRIRYGDMLRWLGRPRDAERELRRALEEAPPENDAVRVALAETLVARAEHREAEALLAEVLAREPRDRRALVARGRLRLSEGRTDEALAGFEAAAAGGHPDALLELAEVHMLLGRVDAAHELAGRVLERSPGHPWALALLGHARVLEGHPGEGAALLRRALSVGPRRGPVWGRLAAGFEAAGRRDLAGRCRARAAELGWAPPEKPPQPRKRASAGKR